MKRVRQRDTPPERMVRQLLTEGGAKYRLNVGGLPGSPDVANKKRKKAIFVHGCFWHYHADCARGRIPTRNSTFWEEKLYGNRERDVRKIRGLEEKGYDVLVVWECQLTDPDSLRERLMNFWFDE